MLSHLMKKKHKTLSELAALTGSTLKGDPEHIITGVEDLESAEESDVSFLENPRYLSKMQNSKAGVIFVQPEVTLQSGRNYLLTPVPSLAFQQVIELFIPQIKSAFSSVHSTAIIHEESKIASGVTIGPHAVIDRGVSIGHDVTIGAGTFIGAETTIEEGTLIYPNVVIREGCHIGKRVIIQPGAVIGSCGFGYFTDKKGHHHLLKQRGRVIIEDDVEIGANTTIDRARFKTTTIKRGTKVDNLVQIAHQVEVGEDNLIISQTGIAGSSKTGKNVVLGGQIGIIGHISITDNVTLAARSAVIKSIDKPGIYSGVPAAPIRECNELNVHLRNLGKIAKRLKNLEERVFGSTEKTQIGG